MPPLSEKPDLSSELQDERSSMIDVAKSLAIKSTNDLMQTDEPQVANASQEIKEDKKDDQK